MGVVEILLILSFIIFIIWSIIDIRNLVIPIKKRRMELIAVSGGVIALLIITVLYAKTWIHYIVFILAVTYFVLMVVRVGITHKGFNSMKRLIILNWDKISSIEVSFKNNDVKVEVFGTFLWWDYQYYKKEDYDRIIGLLHENLPREKVRIK